MFPTRVPAHRVNEDRGQRRSALGDPKTEPVCCPPLGSGAHHGALWTTLTAAPTPGSGALSWGPSSPSVPWGVCSPRQGMRGLKGPQERGNHAPIPVTNQVQTNRDRSVPRVHPCHRWECRGSPGTCPCTQLVGPGSTVLSGYGIGGPPPGPFEAPAEHFQSLVTPMARCHGTRHLPSATRVPRVIARVCVALDTCVSPPEPASTSSHRGSPSTSQVQQQLEKLVNWLDGR